MGARRQREHSRHEASAADFVIRPGAPDDLDEIYALECASFSADRLSRRALRRFLKAPHHPLLAAWIGGRLAGYILVVTSSRSRVARVYSLAVDAAFARRGIGRELLRAGERYALAQGRETMRLEARWDNGAALALYEAQGYRDFGRYPGYYADGAEALRLEKPLKPPISTV